MHEDVKEAIDQIDAAVFSGDTFHDSKDHRTMSEILERWQRGLADVWFCIDEGQIPEPKEPITARINYAGTITEVNGCRSEHEPRVVLFDFYSGTAGEVIIEWKPRKLPNKDDAHPWMGIENKGLG